MQKTSRPLSGVRVLDFTRVLAGPYCTALMADLGAEIIKIEGAGGDDYRHVGPFFDGNSALFEGVNRGKKSIVMDLKDPAEIEGIKALVKTADVVVENFRPGVMERLGLDAASLTAINERLIYASISGFGQTGPHALRPAYDIIVQAMSGMMAITGESEGEPTMIGESIGDVAAGVFGSWGILAALYERERTGKGRVIDLSLHDALLGMMPTVGSRVLLAGDNPVRTGNKHSLSAPFGVYAARNGHFAVAILNDRHFKIFCTLIGSHHFADDARFSSGSKRRANEAVLAEAIESWAKNHDAEKVVDMLSEAGVPASQILTPKDAWTSDQAQHRQLFSKAAGPDGLQIEVPEQPVCFVGDERGGRTRAPKLNQHGDEIRAMIRTLTQ